MHSETNPDHPGQGLTLLKIQTVVPPGLYDWFVAWLFQNVPQGFEEMDEDPDGTTSFLIHLDDSPLAGALITNLREYWPDVKIMIEEVENEDWSLAWKDFFTPIEAGQTFEIVPPWLRDQADRSRTTIVIEPRMAFGTGHHPTTALCLEALGDLHAAGSISPSDRFLDLGTGSGILGIALTMLGLTGYGLDIDPQAVFCARENIRINNAEGFGLAVGSTACLKRGTRFDCLVANILSGPLRAMSPTIVRMLSPGSSLVLSGILDKQADDVIESYQDHGLGFPEVRTSGEWVALVWSDAS